MPALVSFKSESLKKSEKAAEGEMPVDFPVAIVQSESAVSVCINMMTV